MKVKFGFVILHYMEMQTTCECVESVRNIQYESKEIIIVDNASPNDTGRLIEMQYQDSDSIHVILSPQNIGFAKGNNLGFSMAKQLQCDFIVLLNNDTIIPQVQFCDLVIQEYKKDKFGIMGPMILDQKENNTFANPQVENHNTLQLVRIGQLMNFLRYFLSFVGADLFLDACITSFRNSKQAHTGSGEENIKLHGCCYIFAPDAVQRMAGLNPGTFMYLEEDILCITARRLQLSMSYRPAVKIIHLEDRATLAYFGQKPIKARRFQYQCQMASFRVLKKELMNYEN